ncbi:MAG: prolyl-tRNA synthetase associated domain-containing protein [Ruminococcaceae bacterium]|nr:prolyl-tRNA synthetase associated domain-containing protein [Oscillospiraceae bacterium]
MSISLGRPENTQGRLQKEIRTYDFLDSIGVQYYRIDHEPTNKMEACAEIDKELGATICKNLFLCNRGKTSFYLLMMCAEKQFATRNISDQVGSSRLCFGTPEDLERLLDLTPGSVSVMGLMNDKENRVKLLIDEDILKGEYFGCHPCINTTSLRIKTEDLTKKIFPAMHHEPFPVHID